jgi:hypothetical protein
VFYSVGVASVANVLRKTALALIISLAASDAYAQFARSEAAKRQIVVPFIRALTGCVAKQALYEDDAVIAYKQNLLGEYLKTTIQKCPDDLKRLWYTYEITYGPGTAWSFIKGPYSDDLERAVLARIKSQLETKLAEFDQKQILAKQRMAQEAESRRTEDERQAALSRQREEEAKAAAVKAEAETKAAEAKAAAEKQERLDIAKRALFVLRDKFYACVDG